MELLPLSLVLNLYAATSMIRIIANGLIFSSVFCEFDCNITAENIRIKKVAFFIILIYKIHVNLEKIFLLYSVVKIF
jgi:hypothetical protein